MAKADMQLLCASKQRHMTSVRIRRRSDYIRDEANNHTIGRREVVLLKDRSAKVEIYVDMDKLLKEYLGRAITNKRQRFVRGPFEVRAVAIQDAPRSERVEITERMWGPGFTNPQPQVTTTFKTGEGELIPAELAPVTAPLFV